MVQGAVNVFSLNPMRQISVQGTASSQSIWAVLCFWLQNADVNMTVKDLSATANTDSPNNGKPYYFWMVEGSGSVYVSNASWTNPGSFQKNVHNDDNQSNVRLIDEGCNSEGLIPANRKKCLPPACPMNTETFWE